MILLFFARENNIPLIISSSRYSSKEKLLLFVQDSLEIGILLFILTKLFQSKPTELFFLSSDLDFYL